MHEPITIVPPAVPTLSGLARWSEAPTISSTGPFPLRFNHDRGAGRYRCHRIGPGGSCGNNPQIRVVMADPFPVGRPWKELWPFILGRGCSHGCCDRASTVFIFDAPCRPSR